MADVKGFGDRLLEAVEVAPPSPRGGEKDTTAASDTTTPPSTTEVLVAEAESCKNRGNVEFYKGRALAKHTAGKNLLRDACILYAEGLQALAKADDRLLAEGRLDQQQQQQQEKDQDAQSSSANSHGKGEDKAVKETPTTASTSTKGGTEAEKEEEEDPAAAATRRSLPPSHQAASLQRRADAVRPSLYLNLAACNLLLQEWAPAIACCTRVLDDFGAEVVEPGPEAEAGAEEVKGGGGRRTADGRSTTKTTTQEAAAAAAAEEEEREAERSRRREIAAKCLYRRAAARKGGGDVSAARRDLMGALRLRPRDAAISRELKSVEKNLADEEARESLRRETEEGRRRRQQQQQQQQSSSSPGDTVAAATAAATAIPSAAPRTDHATMAGGGASATEEALGAGGGISDKASYTTAAGPLDGEAGLAGQAGRGGGSQVQQEAPRWGNGNGKGEGEKSGAREESEDRSKDRSEKQSGDEEAFPTWNGGECRDGLYAWNQSIREVQVCVKVPGWARARDVRVDIRRLRVSVAVVNGGGGGGGGKNETATAPTTTTTVLLEGVLSRPVQVDECLWTMERGGRVLLYLQKELPADCEPGFEWWACVLEGDPEIDVLACDAGSDASKYPEHAKRRGARALWEHQNKSPEEKLKEEQLRNARRQMEEEAEDRQRDLEKAMKDPKKAELYRQLRETMPDIPISIK